MQILKVEILGLGPLVEKSIEFDALGLNIVVGPNECGKSTLCEAIVAIIYGFSTKAELDDRRSWIASDFCGGRLRLDIRGRQVGFERDFTNDLTRVTTITSQGEEVIFEGDANPRGRTEEPKEYFRLLNEEFGLPNRDIIENSAYFGQLALEVELKEDLRKQVTGAGQADYLQARTDLKELYYQLTSAALPIDGERKRAGERRIESIQSQLVVLREDLRTARSDAERFSRLSSELEEKNSELNEKQVLLNRFQTEANKLQQYLNLVDRRQDISDRENTERARHLQISALQQEIDALEQNIQGDEYTPFRALNENSLRSLRRYLNSDAGHTVREITELQAAVDRIRKELHNERFEPFRRAPDDTGELIATLKELRGQSESLSDKLALIPRTDNPDSVKRGWMLPVASLLVGGIIGAIFGIILSNIRGVGVSSIVGIIIGSTICGLVFGLVGLLIHLVLAARISGKETERIELETRLNESNRLMAATQERLGTLLDSFQEESLDTLIERWQFVKEHRSSLIKHETTLESLRNREILTVLEDPQIGPLLQTYNAEQLLDRLLRFDHLLTSLANKTETLQQFGSEAHDSIPNKNARSDQLQDIVVVMKAIEDEYPTFSEYRSNRSEAQQRLQEMRLQKDATEKRIKELNENLRSHELEWHSLQSSGPLHPQTIEEGIADKEEELAHLSVRRDALILAITNLDASIEDYERDHLDLLSHRTSEYFSKFTRKRYPSVKVRGGGDISIMREGEAEFDGNLLSTGAKDQLYLALRLAVLDLLSANIHLPILLDDSFVNFDQQRLEAAREVMEEIVSDRQTILLSHDDRYREWPGKIIDFAESS